MADRKKVTAEQLKPLIEALAKEEYSPKSLAEKIGSKDDIFDRRIQLRDFLNSLEGSDQEAKEMISSLRNRADHALKVAGSQYASSVKPGETNLDRLNKGEAVLVKANNPAARILEKEASEIDPKKFKAEQLSGRATPNILDVQNMDIAGAKAKALAGMGESVAKKGLKSVAGSLPVVGAALAFSGAREAGASVPEAIAKAAQEEVTNPIIDALLPSSIAQEKPLTDQEVARYQAEMRAKSDEARKKSEKRQANALKFGEEFDKIQQARRNALKKMSERQ